MPAGQKAFSNINTVAGQPSTNQVNLGSTAAQYLGKVPNVNWVRMSDMSNRGLIIGQILPDLSNANSPINIQSPFGSGVVSPWLQLNIDPSLGGSWGNMPIGAVFYVSSRVRAGWAPPYDPVLNPGGSDITPTYSFTKATSGVTAYQTGGTGGNKNYYMITEYDAETQSVRVQGYYSGSSTNDPNGTVYIDRVALV